ncbi:MAG: hypothetical protein Q9177_003237 [Variospora cf. flavescens]
MVATSGAQLLPNSAVTSLREQLLPLTTILTPNIPEAKLLLDNAGVEYPDPTRSIPDLIRVAKSLQCLGPKHVLIKGGHLPVDRDLNVAQLDADKEFVIDVLFSSHDRDDNDDVVIFRTNFSPSKNTHGTGCSLACKCYSWSPLPAQLFVPSNASTILANHPLQITAAIASNLTLGRDMPHAVENACRYVERGIRTAPDLGRGSGPINHFPPYAALEDKEEWGESSLIRLDGNSFT